MRHEDYRSSAAAIVPPEQVRRRSYGRFRTQDNLMTYDSAMRATDSAGNMLGKALGGRFTTHDGRTVDSTGAFLVGELERLDLTLHEPLAAVTWGRDIQLREDVTTADEASSFTISTYYSPGSLGTGQGVGNAKSWIGKDTNQVSRVSVDIAKLTQPLIPWGKELAYTVLELESAAKLGRPVDEQKYRALQLAHQMEIDEMVYYGDTPGAFYGLVNFNNATTANVVTNVANVANGAQNSPLWTLKTPAEILQDFNEVLTSVWAASGWAVMPDTVLLPPTDFGYIATQTVSQAGNVSILNYVLENNITARQGGATLDIKPVKWCLGTGQGGTVGTGGAGHDRIVVYTNEKDRVRYPMTMLSKTPLQYDSIWHRSTYYGRLGVLEVVYPETIGYRDGIS
jgi:hypothetical protein